MKLLNIREEEAKPVFLLMLFSFFIGLSLTFYFTASNAIFLKHFPSRMISFSYISSGIVVYLAWWLLSRIDRKLTLSNQILIKIFFVFITVLAISLGVWIYDTAWLAFTMFTWVRVLVYITLVTFWGLAGKIFNIRQGKRIFGLIGVGEVISIIIGYFSVPLILHFLKAADLLFLSSSALLVCLILVIIILRQFREQLGSKETHSSPGENRQKPEWSYWSLLRQPYFRLISIMAFLPIFGYLFVDFLFLAQTKREFANNPETIARFFGIFLGFVAIVELIFKLISGRLLNKYGLKPSLLSLPLILAFSVLLAAFFGTIYGTVGLFFAFIAFARLFERAVRGAMYEPAFQLLYQPVPNEQRLVFQNQIEGIPKALGTVITGAAILLLSSFSIFTLVHFNYFFLLVLGSWIWIAFLMYNEYRNLLKKKLSEVREEEHTGTDEEVWLIRQHFSSTDVLAFRKVYKLYYKVAPISIEKSLEFIFPEASAEVKKEILKNITDDQIISCQGWISRMIRDGSFSDLKEELARTLHDLKEGENLPFDFLSDLSKSSDAETRARVARLLGYSGRYNTYKLLINLLRDHDPLVKKAAIISSGMIRRYELWPFLIENLNVKEFSYAASLAIRMVGDPILNEVDHQFTKIGEHLHSLIRIIRVYEDIGGDKAIKILRSKIAYPDPEVRFQVLLSLSNLEYHATFSEVPYIRQTIEESVDTIVWIMAAMVDIGGSEETFELQNALLQEMEEKKENIFLLLSLIYEAKTIRHIRENIESPDLKAKIYALEICDMTVSEDIKEFFLPLFEDVSIHERLHRFRFLFPQQKLDRDERLFDIINKDFSRINRWTKSCALNLLISSGETYRDAVDNLLAAQLIHADPLISETAGWVLYQRNPEYFSELLNKFENWESLKLSPGIKELRTKYFKPESLLFNTIRRLKNMPLFAPVHEANLINLALSLDNKDTDKIPDEVLLEYVAGDKHLVDRFLNLLKNQYEKQKNHS